MIVAVNGEELRDDSDLLAIVANRRPGDELRLTYVRGEERRTATVELGARPESQTAANRPGRNRQPNREDARTQEMLGMTLTAFSAQAAQEYGLDADAEGVLITDVERGSAAFRDANIRPGDLIVRVAGEPVASLRDFQEAIDGVGEGETFLLTLHRGGGEAGPQVYRTALTK